MLCAQRDAARAQREAAALQEELDSIIELAVQHNSSGVADAGGRDGKHETGQAEQHTGDDLAAALAQLASRRASAAEASTSASVTAGSKSRNLGTAVVDAVAVCSRGGLRPHTAGGPERRGILPARPARPQSAVASRRPAHAQQQQPLHINGPACGDANTPHCQLQRSTGVLETLQRMLGAQRRQLHRSQTCLSEEHARQQQLRNLLMQALEEVRLRRGAADAASDLPLQVQQQDLGTILLHELAGRERLLQHLLDTCNSSAGTGTWTSPPPLVAQARPRTAPVRAPVGVCMEQRAMPRTAQQRMKKEPAVTPGSPCASNTAACCSAPVPGSGQVPLDAGYSAMGVNHGGYREQQTAPSSPSRPSSGRDRQSIIGKHAVGAVVGLSLMAHKQPANQQVPDSSKEQILLESLPLCRRLQHARARRPLSATSVADRWAKQQQERQLFCVTAAVRPASAAALNCGRNVVLPNAATIMQRCSRTVGCTQQQQSQPGLSTFRMAPCEGTQLTQAADRGRLHSAERAALVEAAFLAQ